MIRNEGFVDLRVSPYSQVSANEDSVWPSFTDIMTVIVMIFLMALVVILIRNVDLVQALRTTMEAERQAAEIARATAAQKDVLEARVDELGNTVAGLRFRIGEVEQERDSALTTSVDQLQQINRLIREVAALETVRDRLLQENEALDEQTEQQQQDLLTLTERQRALDQLRLELEQEVAGLLSDKTIATETNEALTEENRALGVELAELLLVKEALESDRTRLSGQVSDLETERGALDSQLVDLQAEMENLVRRYIAVQQDRESERLGREQLDRELGTLKDEYRLTQEELDFLRAEYAERVKEFEEERALMVENQDALALLQSEFDNLQDDYNRLVRPARNPVGRYVVEVRFLKLPDGYQYFIRLPGEEQPRQVSEDALHAELSTLKGDQADKLYTRVVIPDDSNLTYDEAWRFTNDILSRYDYYYEP